MANISVSRISIRQRKRTYKVSKGLGMLPALRFRLITFLNGSLALCSFNSLVCLLAVVQLPGIEEKESRGPTTWQTAQPDSGSVCGGGGEEGGFRGVPIPPSSTSLPLHSAPHLKALVMHSSSPATSRVIQFARQ